MRRSGDTTPRRIVVRSARSVDPVRFHTFASLILVTAHGDEPEQLVAHAAAASLRPITTAGGPDLPGAGAGHRSPDWAGSRGVHCGHRTAGHAPLSCLGQPLAADPVSHCRL